MFRTEIVLTVLTFCTEIVLTVLTFPIEIVLTVLTFCTEIVLPALVIYILTSFLLHIPVHFRAVGLSPHSPVEAPPAVEVSGRLHAPPPSVGKNQAPALLRQRSPGQVPVEDQSHLPGHAEGTAAAPEGG
jgi:hypothetical protein